MSSRNSMGVPPRAQPRAPSGSALQAHQRGLSSSYMPPLSPVRKDDHHSQPTDPTDASTTSSQASTASRHGATPRRTAGSKLRIELSNDEGLTPGPATDSPLGTPSLLSHSAALDSSTDASGHGSPALSRASHADSAIPPMPMPRRRAPLQRFVPSNKTAAPPTALLKRDSKPKQYTIEVPPPAPRYLSTNKPDTLHRDPFNKGLFSGNADFFPWNGRHHEDEWSTEAIQKGTWDRGSQNETSSARLAVYPSLKQKTGLNALSTIFMGVLNQRRNRGQITAPSTFKPPPRVTLTDTKREVWLKDLANPTISLRRLSRTIPHGIRGRTLLDQCLNKNVPTERAIWLAKCVGANEIRSFKRKGVTSGLAMGNELKWIRDWTIFVEQFVDSIVSSVGEPDWKRRVTYSIRLATVLYSEHLLDRDHYLDWIVSGLEGSNQAKLPMWILIAQICWTDILRSRKPGRRLVFALLNHLNTIYNDPDRDILIPLSNQLVSLLKTLVAKNPESFIQPLQWFKYRECLSAFLPTDARALQQAYRSINQRNSELLVSSAASPPIGGKEHLVKLLDATLYGKVDRELSYKCWSTSEDKTQVLKTVIEWVTSFHRPGLEKIYTATNLLRSWSGFRVNTTGAILDTLDSIEPGDVVRKQSVYRLVTELARTGHFSVSQYIQWLIARGNCHSAADVEETGPCASRLLVELPIYCIPEDRKTDRANLLRRAAHYNVADEARDISMAIQCVNQTVGLRATTNDGGTLPIKPIPLRKLVRRINISSFALKSAVGTHLRNAFQSLLPPRLDTDVSLHVFTSTRAILEATGDFSMLGEVLRSCSRMSNMEVLAACVDTVNVNLQVLLAVGVADDLFALYVERLKAASCEHGLVARPLLAALSSLAQRMPNQGDVAKNLQQELTQTDRSNPIDACSPVSDNMVSQATNPEGEFSEQIDKLLATGNSIDHPTMNRLFRNIVPRLETGWHKLDASRRVYASLLARLRIFDAQHFDKLISDWVSHIRSLKERPALRELLPLLVSLGCLTMVTILHTANAAPVAASVHAALDAGPPRGAAIYLEELLQLILRPLPKNTPLTADESYRFVVYQQSAQMEHAKALLLLIRNAVQEYSILRSRSTTTTLPLDDRTCQDDVLEALRVLVVTNSTAAADALSMKDLAPEAAALIRTVAAKLLTPGDTHTSSSFDKILGLANELTMPFCQLSLSMELSLPQDPRQHEPPESQFDLFARAMDSAIEARNIMWTSMLPCLSDDITQHLRSQAHGRFLTMMPSAKAPDLVARATSEDRIQLAQNLLGVIEAIISGQPPSKSAQLTSTLVDKLTDLWDIISVPDASSAAQDAVRKHWLPFLLRFITLHSIYASSSSSSSSDTAAPIAAGSPAVVNKPVSNVAPPPITTTTSNNHEARARIVLVLCGILFALEAQQSLPPRGKLAQQVFDISLLLVDGLPDDVRLHCARNVLAQPGSSARGIGTSDPRIYYLFSAPRPTAADNLVLAHRDRGAVPLSAAARGLAAMYGIGPTLQERYSHFALRRWEALSEPTPNVGDNDTSLSLGLFEAIKIQ